MGAVSDESLLAGMASADRDAVAVLVRRHQSRVYGLARSIVRDPHLAEDVAQEAFIRAWRYAGAYDPRRGAVLPWLLTITRNAAIDHLRSRRVRPEVPAESVGALLPADRTDPGDRVGQDAEARRTFEALATLPEPQRRAVVLATYAGWTAVEVGEFEGVPLGTAKTRIRTGLSRLRLLLTEEVSS